MKKITLSLVVGIVFILGTFNPLPTQTAQAAEEINASDRIYISNYKTTIIGELQQYYYYNNGSYHGYLTLEDWHATGADRWTAYYSGYVYKGAASFPYKIENIK